MRCHGDTSEQSRGERCNYNVGGKEPERCVTRVWKQREEKAGGWEHRHRLIKCEEKDYIWQGVCGWRKIQTWRTAGFNTAHHQSYENYETESSDINVKIRLNFFIQKSYILIHSLVLKEEWAKRGDRGDRLDVDADVPECTSQYTWWGLTARASWGERKMSGSVSGWFKLTKTLPCWSALLWASLAWMPLGSLSSSSTADSLLMCTMESSSPELKSITSAKMWRRGRGELLCVVIMSHTKQYKNWKIKYLNILNKVLV